MCNFNSNDYLIMRSVIDKENNRGVSKAKGSTIEQICEKCGLSNSKVRISIRSLVDAEYIGHGVKLVNKNTYYITEKGIKELQEISRNILEG